MIVNDMTAIMPHGNYTNIAYPSAIYRMRNKNALKHVVKRTIKIEKLGEHLYFKKPIDLQYSIDEGYYTSDFCAGGLIIASAEKSLDDMVDDIRSQFCHAWRYYAEECDNNLTEDAKKIKKWFLEKVRSE